MTELMLYVFENHRQRRACLSCPTCINKGPKYRRHRSLNDTPARAMRPTSTMMLTFNTVLHTANCVPFAERSGGITLLQHSMAGHIPTTRRYSIGADSSAATPYANRFKAESGLHIKKVTRDKAGGEFCSIEQPVSSQKRKPAVQSNAIPPNKISGKVHRGVASMTHRRTHAVRPQRVANHRA